jgi:hypothetical protein
MAQSRFFRSFAHCIHQLVEEVHEVEAESEDRETSNVCHFTQHGGVVWQE